MMKRILTLIIVSAAVIMAVCSSTASEKAEEKRGDNVLVAYFSAQGHTSALAEKIAQSTGGSYLR